MARARAIGITALLIIWGELAPRTAHAQALGTFRWQLQPFCNVVTVSVTQNGGVYTMDGYDDQCGASTRAPVVGLATPNPDGSIGMGFHVVTTPSATPVSVQATISLATLGGTWRDSAGNTGTFAFGAATGGNPRPPAVATFPAGVAAGGARVTNVGTPTQPTDAATKGYVDAADATLAAQLPPSSLFTFQADGGFVARAAGFGPIPAEGPGTRFMWYAGKGALRAGRANQEWEDARIGRFSIAIGELNEASGGASVALGADAIARGVSALAAGYFTRALGSSSIALGNAAGACGDASVAMGSYVSTSTAPSADSRNPCGGSAHSGAIAISSAANGVYFTTVANHEVAIRGGGGIRLRTNIGATTGCNLASGSGVWTCTSDRASKEGFEPVDGEDVLRRLAAMPIGRWSYKTEPGVRHVGPVAQDFWAAFRLGTDDKSIGHLHLAGISLRAIQALEARTEAQQITIDELKTQNALLRQRLEALELRASATPPAPR